jgi:hypothetical protein
VGVVGLKPPDPAVVRAWVERTRAAQGLPETLEDPVVIAGIVALVAQALQTGSTRPGSKVVRPGTAERMTARSKTAETIER